MKYTVIIEKDTDGWFTSDVLELPGCHTQAKNLDELTKRTTEAIKAYVGEKNQSQFVGIQQIEVND